MIGAFGVPKIDIRVHWTLVGAHVRCAVFCNGKAGDLVFGAEDWPTIQNELVKIATVIHDGPQS